MCGIVGSYIFSVSTKQISIDSMINSLYHRGPDDSGCWKDEKIILGHTRLSIHDISSAGHQPMFSNTGNTVIVFNGEIYNYLSVKKELINDYPDLHFKSNSDTEILVNAIELWGIDKTLEKCIGMFAFGAYCRKTKQLILARDRFGEKPLYYGVQEGILGFASELKALKPLKESGWLFDIDRGALATYMRYSYIPTPYSIYKNISKLNVGSYIVFEKDGNKKETKYWDSKRVLTQPRYAGTYDEALIDLESKLKNTLSMQIQSDVPLGAFLSGGIDSTTIVALMQSISKDKINTFSIGFNQKEYNEAEHARAVAKHIGTNHTDTYVTERDALDVIPKLAEIYDEPFADSSQIPTYLVSKIAKSKVTVALSGDAGDELFGGYERYFLTDKLYKNMYFVKYLRYTPDAFIKYLPNTLFGKFNKLKEVASISKSKKELYDYMTSTHKYNDLVLDAIRIINPSRILGEIDINNIDYRELMMFIDSNTYLIDDILLKVDRAAMANSLETRAPFLDHNIYEFAYSLPVEYKMQNHNGKRILKDLLYKYVPKSLVDRPKMGFSVPLNSWLRNELKDWANQLLDYNKIKAQGYLNADLVHRYWQEHLNCDRSRGYLLWNVLMFQEWLNSN
ncbi:asparagine synthase (glutamine-hydrolyzing) [Francisella tularensis]|uniref:asparagine synthase (glutamine-hydrolyzing) n=1 Tax=Francisella tularensis TaxID=263 RepID=UPI001C0EE3FB|nr:asparagine synthase (glutamine-hydrolyzing) [Francisella tularensis]MBK2110037.1 asparagine synthase (glutamine-hydrolyzing) [Francisella tularensis subsp. novicida FSC595]